MFSLDGNKITLTRGDTAVIGVSLTGYEPKEGDEIVMTLKRKIRDTEAVLTKYMDHAEELYFKLEPEDTIDLLGSYVYDVQLTTAEGDVYTPIMSTIKLERGVTE
jgi:hypothetical protein